MTLKEFIEEKEEKNWKEKKPKKFSHLIKKKMKKNGVTARTASQLLIIQTLEKDKAKTTPSGPLHTRQANARARYGLNFPVAGSYNGKEGPEPPNLLGGCWIDEKVE